MGFPNPLKEVEDFVKRQVEAAELRLHIKLLEEATVTALSRLMTLNPDAKRQADYQGALRLIQKD